ncbi:MAG TPA: DUF262 domain-containing protein [Actinomycetota bacterium]|nr:DUF262 domain-containing protein [Actinomycetota bacterium]
MKKVLDKIHDRSYVLPAIQREFVWSTDQIRMLFDSLLRGYPIGSFLFWDVGPTLASQFRFYDFLVNYHEKNHPYASATQVPPGKSIVAILDGQQRLTSLNIGLYGSHAERQPRKWASNPDAYPKKRLYLDLTGEAPEADGDLGLEYSFRFLTDAEARPKEAEPDRWFVVGDVLKLANSGPAIHKVIQQRDLLSNDRAFDTLYELYRAVLERPSINAYLEEAQEPDKVLDIFVRVNSAGTQLSYSDLLLSMATNQWTVLDAREEVRSLVTELNGEKFAYTKDLVLKAGLVLIDVPDVGFKVSNFTEANMATMEKRWPELRSALLVARSVLASFGYSAQTLSAASVLIPVAYYVHQRGLGTGYVTSSAAAADRRRVESWVNRSLMKRGVWGSGLDTLLNRLRDVLRTKGTLSFPLEALETAMAALGKPLRFEEAEIAELLDLRYGRPRTFATLAVLYPGLDMTKAFHVDHVFPRSRFTATKLSKAGIPAKKLDEYLARVDGLPNLQLLDGLPNVQKQDAMPAEWMAGPHFTSAAARQHYAAQNDLDGLGLDLADFLEFYDQRRERMAVRLGELLVPPIEGLGTAIEDLP